MEKIVEWNSNAESVFLWTKEEVLNNYLYEYIIPERFVEAHKKGIKKYITTGQESILNNRIEIVGINKEHNEFPIELAITSLKINNEVYFSAFIRDISERTEIRNKLNEERNLFIRILESITEPIFYKTKAHKYLRCNQAFADLHNLTSQEIIGKSDKELYSTKETKKFIESDLAVINDKKAIVNEEWFTYKGGKSKYLNTIKLPSYDENGKVQGIVGICRDLTELKKAESKHRHLNIEMQKVIKRLKANEKYLKGINRFASTILKQNTIGEIIWEVTENLIQELGVVDCVIYLLDDQKKDLIQRAAYGPKQLGEQKIKNPIVIQVGQGIVGTVAKTGISELITDTSLDSRYIVDDEVRLSEITVPIIADGEVIGIIDSEHPEKNYFSHMHLEKLKTIANLVSSRLKDAINQEKLYVAQKSILKLSTAVEQSTLSIIITDIKGIIEFVNPAFEKLSGYKSHDAIGKRTNLLKSGKHPDSYYKQMWETILAGEKWTGEIINRSKDGDTFTILAAISPIKNVQGIVTNFVAFQTDITERIKAELKLQTSQANLKAVLENTDSMIWSIDINYCLATSNSVFQKMVEPFFGTLLNPGTYLLDAEKVGDEIVSQWKLLYDRALQNDSFITELPEDESGNVYEMSYNPIINPKGKVIGVSIIGRNITHRKHIEDTIIKKQKMLQGIAKATEELHSNPTLSEAIFNSLSTLGHSVDVHRTYLFENKINEEGIQVVSQCYEWTAEAIHSQITANGIKSFPLSFIQVFLPHFNRKEPLDAIVSNLDDELTIKKIFESRNVKSVLIVPVFFRESLWGFLGYDDCVDERHWTDDELLSLKSFGNSLSVAIEKTETTKELNDMALFPQENPDPIVRINLKGEILVENNPAELLRTIKHHESGRSQILDVYEIISARVNSKNQVDSFQFTYGHQIFHARSVLSKSNKYINIYFRDVTKQKSLEAELESALEKSLEASEAKELFLANMSHEIRTPLNGIIGMIREFSRGQMSSVQRNTIDSAMKASKHLLSLVNNILDVTKIEAGEFNLNPIHFSIQTLLNDVSSILTSQADLKNLELIINLDKNVPEVFIGDEARIRQILINIAGNAIKFTQIGHVTISCYCNSKSVNTTVNNSDRNLILTIQDSGPGMGESTLVNIFNKFQQEKLSGTGNIGGTGLGMYITKQLVDIMGGSLKVDSKKGIGTEIMISLPLPLGDISNVVSKDVLVNKSLLYNARILLVEDNEMNRVVACNTLKQFNVEVTEVVNGEEAVNLLKKKTFDIILMDIQMPVMDGIEATEIIRNNLKIQTPIIALSANALKTKIDACMAIGMNDYITKPFEDQELFQVIARHYKTPIDLKQKNMPEDNSQTEVSDLLYDLSKLKKMSMGNDAFMEKMLTLFVDTYPLYIEELKSHLDKGDIDSLKNLAHKIKPSLNDLAVTSIKQEIVDIESFDKNESSLELLKSLVDKVTSVLTEVVNQIKKHQNL